MSTSGIARTSSGKRTLDPRQAERLALLLFCLAAFAWRVSGLTAQSLWRDEVDSIRFAGRALPALLRTFSKPGENGPLYFLLLRPWLAVAGQSEFALRFPSVLGGTLAIPLTWLLARRLWGNARTGSRLAIGNAPLIAALLAAVNPYLTWYGQEGRMYTLLLALVLAVHLAFLAALRHGQLWHWLLYLVLLTLAVLTHLLAVLLVPVHLAWLIILSLPVRPVAAAVLPGLPGRLARRRWLPFILVLLLPALPYFILIGWWQLRLFLSPDFQTGHPFLSLTDLLSVLFTGFSFGIAMPPRAALVTPFLFLLLVGMVMGLANGRTPRQANDAQPPTHGPRRPGSQRAGHGQEMRQVDRRWATGLLIAWLLLPPLLLFLISLRKPLFTDRYLIWIGPAFILLLAQGLRYLSRTWRPLGWLGLTFLMVLAGLAGWRQTHTPIKSDFRAAAAYVTAHRRPGDRLLFQIPYIRYTFEYYAGPSRDWADGPYTNNDNPEEQVAAEMEQAVGDAPAVWLIASEEALWDRRGLTRQWLETHGHRTDSARFTRVEVIRYVFAEEPR